MKHSARQPHLSSAAEIAQALAADPAHLQEITAQIDRKSTPALEARLDSMMAQWTSMTEAENRSRLADIVDRMATDSDGSTKPFDAFSQLVEDELAGLVVTAHPTFSLSAEATDYAKAYIGSRLDGAEKPACSLSQLRRDTSPTLHEELAQANHALINMRRALRVLYEIVFERAASHYPEEYRSLRPKLATIASWVGFDLDGRTDIDWSLGLLFRYRTAIAGLDECCAIIGDTDFSDPDAAPSLQAIKDGLDELRSCFLHGQAFLADYQNGSETLGAFNGLTVENQARKEKARAEINAAFEGLMATGLETEDWIKAAVLFTEWSTVGIGLSHIHFRLNAAQLHNAISPEINLTRAPDQSAMRRHYLAAISEKLGEVKPQTVHYGILADERTTAKRVFMMAAQFRKHFDAATQIRMLVAESDTSFTLLAALYYARMFGVDDYVEISPLFETAVGLERGDRVIAELIDNPHFLDYIRSQGRFCVQLGFSDSGRYIGQPAACLAIERFKLRLTLLWEARGLGDIQLLFFDTHGESIGRGAAPQSLKNRFLYTQPPRVREFLGRLNRPEKHEVSFQGGEGFLWFATRTSALATLTDFIDVRFGDHTAQGDQLYDEKGWALDFFLSLVEYHDHLTEHPGYVRLIDSIGPRLLYPTGSRSTKRQGNGAISQRLEKVSQIRAIPNNAILQQLGYMANTCAGYGTAIDRSPEKFFSVYGQSYRLQSVTAMAKEALARSDIGVLEAYAEMLSPAHWLDLADATQDENGRANLRRLSKIMENLFDSDSISACVRKLRRDAGLMQDSLAEFSASGIDVPEANDTLIELHGLRLGLIQFIFMKAMEIPRFSSRLDVSLDELLVELLHLEVGSTLTQLRTIFPVGPSVKTEDDFGEDVTYAAENGQGYSRVHAGVFDPIEQAYAALLAISGLIAMQIGAFG